MKSPWNTVYRMTIVYIILGVILSSCSTISNGEPTVPSKQGENTNTSSTREFALADQSSPSAEEDIVISDKAKVLDKSAMLSLREVSEELEILKFRYLTEEVKTLVIGDIMSIAPITLIPQGALSYCQEFPYLQIFHGENSSIG